MTTYYLRECTLIPTYYRRQRGRWWFALEGDEWVDEADERYPREPGEAIYTEAVADRFEDLDWTLTSLLRPREGMGWLSPDGNWWGCLGFLHDKIPLYLLKTTVQELEERGWARFGNLGWACCRPLTADQRAYMDQRYGEDGWSPEDNTMADLAALYEPGGALYGHEPEEPHGGLVAPTEDQLRAAREDDDDDR